MHRFMNIEILTYLEENPIKFGQRKNYPIEGLPLTEIEALETKYNGGNPFPKASRSRSHLASVLPYRLWRL